MMMAGDRNMAAAIVQCRRQYQRVALREPAPAGYLHIAAVIEPPAGRTPIPRRTRRKTALLATRTARYDVAVLIETATPGSISDVEQDAQYRQLLDSITPAARELHLMRARCLRRVGDVDKTRQGLFLFNYFAASDPGVALDLWDHLAGWYAAETGLDNSTLPGPQMEPIPEGGTVSIELNHTIVPARDPKASAEFLAGILGLTVGPQVAHFTPVTLSNSVTLDFDKYDEFESHHYAFLVSDEEFDAAFARIQASSITFYADPACQQPGQTYGNDSGRRGAYFRDPNGHLMEILTPAA